MRRLMVTLAVVLGAAVIDVEAQHHETEAKPVAKTEPAKAEAKKAEPAAQSAAKTRSVNELAENISHVAVVIDSWRGRVMPVRERLGLDTKAAKEETKATKTPKRASDGAEASEAHETRSVPAKTPARIELNWRAPPLVWPEELTQQAEH